MTKNWYNLISDQSFNYGQGYDRDDQARPTGRGFSNLDFAGNYPISFSDYINSKQQSSTKLPEPNRCSLPQSSGPCQALFIRWYHNVEKRTCEEFAYGG